jgi:dTDP-4-dehydrorhamnose reductase
MILVTGCNPLGCGLVDAMSAELAKGACDHHNPEIPRGWLTYDALSQESITRLVEEQHTSVIILTEENSSLSYCQEHRKDAVEYNTRSVRFFAEAAKKVGARVVYRSTAFVFDGRKPGGLYTETDQVNPIDVYGETKLMGEVHVDKVPGFLVVRMGELYGPYEDNCANYVKDLMAWGEKVDFAKDMYFSPVYIDDAVSAIRMLTVNKMAGFYNIAGPERISHLDFGRRIAAKFGISEEFIVPKNSAELGLIVPMPLDTSLDFAKLSPLMKMRDIDEGLAAMKAQSPPGGL